MADAGFAEGRAFNLHSAGTDLVEGSALAVKGASGAIAVDGFTETGASALVALAVGGGTPHDSVDSGNPIKIGGKALTSGSIPAAVSLTADRVDAWFNMRGSQGVFLAGNDASSLIVGVVDESGASAVDALAVGGGTPHDAVDSGNPIKIGGKASTSPLAAVAVGDRVEGWFTRVGQQMVSFVGTGSSNGADAQGLIAMYDNLGTSITQPLSVGGAIFNGANWDRIRGTQGVTAGANTDLGILASGIGPGFARIPAVVAATGVTTATVSGKGASQVVFDVAGTFTGFAATVQVSYDGTTYLTANTNQSYIDGLGVTAFGTGIAATAVVGRVLVNTWGAQQVRLNITAVASGTANVTSTANAVGDIPAASVGGGTEYVGDAPASATPTGTISMGLANAAAPADVSANNDAVAAWMLRNGSLVSNLALGGTLVAGATSPLPTRVTDGTAYYTKTGQLASTASFSQLSDQTTAVGVIVGTTALKTDLSSVAGTATVTAGLAGTAAVGGPIAHDGVATNISPQLIGGYASAAAPADVSLDGDATRLWVLRNGSPVVNIAAGGTLLTNTGQAAASANFGKITDGTLTVGAVDETGASAVDALAVGGGTPHDSVDSGNPVKIGGKARSALPTSVASNDRVDAWFGVNGQMIVGAFVDTSTDGASAARTAWLLAPDGNQAPLSAYSMLYNGTGLDRPRSIQSVSAAPNVDVGIQAVGIGPGYDRKTDPAGVAATSTANAVTVIVNGADTIGFHVTTIGTTPGAMIFETTNDDTNWSTAGAVLKLGTETWVQGAFVPAVNDVYLVRTTGLRQVRYRVQSVYASGSATVKITGSAGVSMVKSIDVAAAPHNIGFALVGVSAQYTSAQTSITIGPTVSATQRMVVTSIQIQCGGTVAATQVSIYFGTGAFSRGTSKPIFDGEFAPSATSKPGYAQSPPVPFMGAADEELRITSVGAANPLTVLLWYYLVSA